LVLILGGADRGVDLAGLADRIATHPEPLTTVLLGYRQLLVTLLERRRWSSSMATTLPRPWRRRPPCPRGAAAVRPARPGCARQLRDRSRAFRDARRWRWLRRGVAPQARSALRR
jgi:hypothetical protein